MLLHARFTECKTNWGKSCIYLSELGHPPTHAPQTETFAYFEDKHCCPKFSNPFKLFFASSFGIIYEYT